MKFSFQISFLVGVKRGFDVLFCTCKSFKSIMTKWVTMVIIIICCKMRFMKKIQKLQSDQSWKIPISNPFSIGYYHDTMHFWPNVVKTKGFCLHDYQLIVYNFSRKDHSVSATFPMHIFQLCRGNLGYKQTKYVFWKELQT